MAQYTNFYETLKEAQMRLEETIVLYDGVPYHLLAITDHKQDGIFRAYLDPVSDSGTAYHTTGDVPYLYCDEPGISRGQRLDNWMETSSGKASPIIRKMLNSPKFNKFRPFPLGMMNTEGKAVYVERAPTRHTQQGLTGSGLTGLMFDLVTTGMSRRQGSCNVTSNNPGLYSTIMGIYPDIDTTLTKMTDASIANTSTGFSREFAVVRGPMDLMFVAYKGEVVGYLPYNNTTEIKVADKFSYVKEAIDELACFNKIS